MLRKLLKYELLAEYRKYAVIYIGIIITSLSFFITDKFFIKFRFFEVLSALLGMTFFLFCFAAIVLTIVFSINRFHKNLFKDEGYLMHTLPVNSWEHIAVKIISAYIWLIAGLLVIAVGISIFTGGFEWLRQIINLDLQLELLGAEEKSTVITMITITVIGIIIGPAAFLIYIFFCIAVGSLFNKNKNLMAVVTYIAVYMVSQAVSTVIMFASGYFKLVASGIENPFEILGLTNRFIIMSGIALLIIYGAMAFFTNYIMSKRLNLE